MNERTNKTTEWIISTCGIVAACKTTPHEIHIIIIYQFCLNCARVYARSDLGNERECLLNEWHPNFLCVNKFAVSINILIKMLNSSKRWLDSENCRNRTKKKTNKPVTDTVTQNVQWRIPISMSHEMVIVSLGVRRTSNERRRIPQSIYHNEVFFFFFFNWN